MSDLPPISDDLFSSYLNNEDCLTSIQLETSTLLQSFCSEATSSSMLLGMMSGNLFGLLTKTHCSKLLSSFFQERVLLTRGVSTLSGCMAEAVGMQSVPHFLNGEILREEGFQGWIHLSLTMVLMKGIGCAKISNPFLQHGAQDIVMVEFDRFCGVIGLIQPVPAGFVEAVVHAETMSLQMSVSGCLLKQAAPKFTYFEAKQEIHYRSGLSSSKRNPGILKTLSSPLLVPEKLPQGITSAGTLKNIPIRNESSELIQTRDLYCKSELLGEGSKVSEPFAEKIRELRELHQVTEATEDQIVLTVREYLEDLVKGTGSRVAVRSLKPSRFCEEAGRSPKQFKDFLEAHFSSGELKHLGRVYTDPSNAAPKAFGVMTGVLAAKQAAAELLNLSFSERAREIQFRFGRPVLIGKASEELGSRGLLSSETCDGDLAIGISILEESFGSSGYVGFGVDATNFRVKYTSPDDHARKEAIYKGLLATHSVRQYNARTGADLIRLSSEKYALIGKSATAARKLRKETENHPDPVLVEVRDWRVEETTFAIGAIPVQTQKISKLAEWKEKIRFNCNLLREKEIDALDSLFSYIARRSVLAVELIPLLIPMMPGYEVSMLSFSTLSEGSIRIYGEVTERGKEEPVFNFTRDIHTYENGIFAPYAEGVGIRALQSEDRHKKKGIGTLLTLNQLLFFRALGVKSFRISVGGEGNEFWPKVGVRVESNKIAQWMKDELWDFIDGQRLILSPAELERFKRIQYSWEIIRFGTKEKPTIGEDFFKVLPASFIQWDGIFDLDPSYPGWAVLRIALRKRGFEHLLPDKLGKNP